MPAVGKTTLLAVTCVWAAQHDYTLTVVLGDVVSVLNTVRDLERYGVKAAPILGQATRGRHLQQLHRPADPGLRRLPLLDDDRLKWVSTACTLQGFLDIPAPWKLRDAPCQDKLTPWDDDPDKRQNPGRDEHYDCPMFPTCGRHEASRALVEASIWVATAPSLLHCRVPSQLTDDDALPPAHARPTCTSPAGRSGPASSGPATPTVLTARSVCKRVRQPTAMASATSALTAPFSSISVCGTPSNSTLSRLS